MMENLQGQQADVLQHETTSLPERESHIKRFPSSAHRLSFKPWSYRYGTISKAEYELINSSYYGEEDVPEKNDFVHPVKKKKWWLATMIIGIFLMTVPVLLYRTIGSNHNSENKKLRYEKCSTVEHGYHCQPDISRFWGPYSPYFSVPSEIAADIPDQCQITFAQVLSRHGAREPTLHNTEKYRKLIDVIHKNATNYSDEFAFIKDYKYTLGANMLTRFGQQEMVDSGVQFFNRYKSSIGETTPFIRASGQTRVIESAQNWTQGFHNARLQHSGSSDEGEYPYNIIIISEEKGSNNTLDHGICHEFEEGYYSEIGNNAKSTWASVFTPSITTRLNSNMPGVNLSAADTIDFMSICPFETVANENGLVSPFCGLFSEKDWHAYDYYQLLGKFYKFSWGNPLGPSQGVGYINELIARMTNKPVDDHTCTNSTLDNDPKTFPIGGNTTLYADFSHDNNMLSIFSNLGLYKSTPQLSNTTLEDAKTLKGLTPGWVIPFGARAYIEKMKCSGIDEELVRMLVNDRVVPFSTCNADAMGRCKLSDFIDSLTFAKKGGNWDRCYR